MGLGVLDKLRGSEQDARAAVIDDVAPFWHR
jgi:hypothetical protein